MNHKIFSINPVGRDFIVGDIHGCYKQLCNLMKALQFDKKHDRMFSVGDLIDRGPQSLDCLRLLDEPWFHAVIGNHEEMLVEGYLKRNTQDTMLHRANGGEWIDFCDKVELTKLAETAEKLPVVITVHTPMGRIGISHADPVLNDWDAVVEDVDRLREKLVWSRDQIMYRGIKEVKNVLLTYHGHTPLQRVVQIGNTRFIDTGAVFGGHLTVEQLN